MRDVVGVQVLHDVRQPVDDELALIALQRALLEVVGERERAILEHHAVLLTVRVLIVVDELDDVLGAQLLEEGDLVRLGLGLGLGLGSGLGSGLGPG